MNIFTRTSRMAAILGGAILLLTPAFTLPAAAQAGGGQAPIMVAARLVAASSTGNTVSPELADVVPLLQETLRFTSYQLACARHFPLGERIVKLEKGLTLGISKVENNECTVTVNRQGRPLVSMRVRLAPGHPVVVGSIPDADGSSLFVVLTAK